MAVDLSVAIIFKNEIRCIERCLKSLQPLKERLSLEIVMSDTGSTDGSREVAERYADVLVDFPWINDFAAARNSALERCTGRWTLVIDCDEWLDENIDELVDFLKSPRADRQQFAMLVVRSYYETDMETYGDVLIPRLMRMSANPRYQGAIHETPEFNGEPMKQGTALKTIVLHHDGYIMLNDDSEAGKAKRQRNIELLRKELEEQPNNLRRINQMLDVEKDRDKRSELARRAVPLAAADPEHPYALGILRNAVQIAENEDLPEFEEWIETVERLFPKSYAMRVDVNYLRSIHAMGEERYEDATRWGEEFLRWRRKYKSDDNAVREIVFGCLNFNNDGIDRDMRLALARAYQKLSQFERSYAKLKDLPWNELSIKQTMRALKLTAELRASSDLTLDSLMLNIWDGIHEEVPDKERARKREEAFLTFGRMLFGESTNESGEKSFEMDERAMWRIFLPLRGQCILGDAAALLAAETPEEADELFAHIDDFTEFPVSAFIHALEIGASFPLPDRPLTVEKSDILAARLIGQPDKLCELAICAAGDPAFASNSQDMLWVRALVFAAVQSFDWAKGENGMKLARAFAAVERVFLPWCYTQAALDDLYSLPPLHRLGAYVVRAFDALDGGDALGCVRALRTGLQAAPEMKDMVSCILNGMEMGV